MFYQSSFRDENFYSNTNASPISRPPLFFTLIPYIRRKFANGDHVKKRKWVNQIGRRRLRVKWWNLRDIQVLSGSWPWRGRRRCGRRSSPRPSTYWGAGFPSIPRTPRPRSWAGWQFCSEPASTSRSWDSSSESWTRRRRKEKLQRRKSKCEPLSIFPLQFFHKRDI